MATDIALSPGSVGCRFPPESRVGLALSTAQDRDDNTDDTGQHNDRLGHNDSFAYDKAWAWEDLNLRPHPYQGCALTV